MMRSLSSAVAGLRTHQTKMDVIGNNIANVNTYGFKASRATFSDVYYQTLSGGRSAGSGMGGTNPTQIGYGASVATIDIMNTQSGSSSTDRAMDVYITGDGFLVSRDASGNYQYSRLGNLGFDAAGNLVDGNGQTIMGFPMANGVPQIPADGKATTLVGIQVSPDLLDKLTGISISTSGAIIGLLPGDAQMKAASGLPEWINRDQITIPATSTYSGPVKMAISGFTEADLMETALGLSAGQIKSMEMGDLPLNAANDYTIKFETSGKISLTRAAVAADPTATPPVLAQEAVNLTGYLQNGKVVLKDTAGNIGLTINFADGVTTPAADKETTAFELKLYQQMITTDKGGNTVKDPATPKEFTATTYPATLQFGDLSVQLLSAPTSAFNANIGTASIAESEKINIGNLVIAKFRNNQGLQQAGSSYYEETSNSGEATFVRPGLEGTGQLMAGYLEMSNVDVSKEFTDMITTQRGFQANTRIITVSDEMLQELVNLKR